MFKVLLRNTKGAYLPEIDAYINFFNGKSDYYFYKDLDIKDVDVNSFDIIWSFMGIDTEKHEKFRVHDYASLSTGKFPLLKNSIKKIVNKEPSLRLFLNDEVKNGFCFNDKISYVLRDMGVDASFFLSNPSNKKEYDYVYVGAISTARRTDVLLRRFKKDYKNKSLLVIGDITKDWLDEFKADNITYTGRLPYSEVAKTASLSVHGINWVPYKYPYYLQTSTKLLEYMALGLKIVTNEYPWVNNFEQAQKSKFYKVNENFDLDFASIEKYDFITSSVEHFRWETVLKDSMLEEKLNKMVYGEYR